MTFDELRNEVCAIRSQNALSPAEEDMVPVLLELIDALDNLSVRVQELALDQLNAKRGQ